MNREHQLDFSPMMNKRNKKNMAMTLIPIFSSNMLQISRLQLILCILLPILIESKGNLYKKKLSITKIHFTSDTWTYENKNQWQEKHHYCDGNLQSPIDIHLNQSAYNPHLKRMYFEKVLLPTTKLSLMNNGYTGREEKTSRDIDFRELIFDCSSAIKHERTLSFETCYTAWRRLYSRTTSCSLESCR